MKNKGITLIALVITIIILLILAGITIAQLTGSGLFENARLAEEEYKNAQEKEDEILEDYRNKISEYVDSSRSDSDNSIKMNNLIEQPETITSVNQEITLKESMFNYDYLEVEVESNWPGYNSEKDCFNSYFIRVNTFNEGYKRGYLCDLNADSCLVINKKADNNNILVITGAFLSGEKIVINKIIGIKI